MTDKTNPNRWTAEVGPSRYYHFKVAVVSDRGRTVPIDRLTDEQAESLAEQINRPAPTARPPWFLALDVWMAMGGDSRDFDAWAYGEPRSTWGDRWAQLMAAIRGSDLGLDTNPPAGRLVDVADAWNANRPTPTAPADDLPPGVERISDGTLWLVIPEPDGDTLAEMRLALLPDGWQWVHPNRSVEADEPVMVQVRPITPAEPATEWVPWWEALRDELPLVGLKGKTARKAIPSGIGKYGVALIHVEIAGCEQVNLRADGMVEVQR